MGATINISVITSLYRCEKFLAAYLQAVSRMTNLYECEFILVHNDPTDEELEIIRNFHDSSVLINHLIVEREGLYSSWNRAIRLSRGKYLTVWNVDDLRFADSINLQARALDNDPKAAIAYGDMYGSVVYGQTSEKLYRFPEWKQNRFEFYRSYLMSCFQMWRKSDAR
jgi:glycosyltransferase involved in cell wall biosynthesis